MCLGKGNVEHRRAVAVDPAAFQLMRNQSKTQIKAARSVFACKLGLLQWRQPLAPERRAQALHTPALLVNGNGRLAPHSVPHLVTEPRNLCLGPDIARKEDEPERVHIAKKRPLLPRKLMPVRIKDARAKTAHLLTTGIQSARSATSAAQKRRESDRSAKPIARRR